MKIKMKKDRHFANPSGGAWGESVLIVGVDISEADANVFLAKGYADLVPEQSPAASPVNEGNPQP